MTTGGIADAAVLDVFAFDPRRGEVLLVMEEPRPWNGGDEQLHQLQEKFNAYASFVLDGEMAAAHPELIGKPVRIELRCAEMPDERAIALLGAIHDQLALQEIMLEVIVRERSDHECGCAQSSRIQQLPDSG